jgi:transposase
VELYARVRRAVIVDKMSEREAARQFGLTRETVRKMLRYAVPPGYRRQQPVRRPKLDAWVGTIDQILEQDKAEGKKQRHTAKRIFERLRDEHSYTGGYRNNRPERSFLAAFAFGQAPSPQSRIPAVMSQNVMSALNQQLSKIRISATAGRSRASTSIMRAAERRSGSLHWRYLVLRFRASDPYLISFHFRGLVTVQVIGNFTVCCCSLR